MNPKNRFLLVLFYIAAIATTGFAQAKFNKVTVDKTLKDTFSFPKRWAYRWDVFKDRKTKKFTRATSGKVQPRDTAHLQYTANCVSDVQGGYEIRYCAAKKTKNLITLTFEDGLPAYANVYDVLIQNGIFCFKPNISYPSSDPKGMKTRYEVVKQELTLKQNAYKIGEKIVGCINIEFVEISTQPHKKTSKHAYYFRGYFKTMLQ